MKSYQHILPNWRSRWDKRRSLDKKGKAMNAKRDADESSDDGNKKGRGKAQSAKELKEVDFAGNKMGNNQLHGNDQLSTHNQRQAQPDVKTEPDDVIESLKKLDKNVRAERDLGKNNKSKR